MYVRVWFADGAVSDRPCTITWDGMPAAEWPAAAERRTIVASQGFHDDGTPACDRAEWPNLHLPVGCGHVGILDPAVGIDHMLGPL